MDALFVLNSALLGVGLAMDAFSVSLANGLSDSGMRKGKMLLIAGTFAGFQFAMPLLGWFFVCTMVSCFTAVAPLIPWIALALLAFIGGKMLLEGLRRETASAQGKPLTLTTLLLQGIATSIDALSVGFTIAEYPVLDALAASLIIAAVTFVICMAGVLLGKRFGTRLSDKAQVLGGCILIAIGLEIFLTGIL